MTFLIKSEKLEQMHELFLNCAEILKLAAEEKRNIVLRHHNDTDGYSAGFSIEYALRQILHNHRQITRISNSTPYYDYTDALRDVNSFLLQKSRFDVKPPILILADFGSNKQSIKAIERVKKYGFVVIIVDHHMFDNVNKETVDVFINPHITDTKSHAICAGALGVELAQFIVKCPELTTLAALSSVADMMDGVEALEYITLSGISKEDLRDWALFFDQEAYYLKFLESHAMLKDLLMPSKKDLVSFLSAAKNIQKEFEPMKTAIDEYAIKTKMKNFAVYRIDKTKLGKASFTKSKVSYIMKKMFKGPYISMAENPGSISFRAIEVPNFSLTTLLKKLKTKIPYALVSGGGHEVAGTITFNLYSRELIHEKIDEYLETL